MAFFFPVRAGVLPVDRPQLQRDVHPGRPGSRQLRLHTPRHGQWSSERKWLDGRDSNPLKIAQWKRTTDRRFCSVLQPALLFCFLPVSGTLMLLMLLLLGFIYLFIYFLQLQCHIPELETPLSERVRAFVDWLQDNRAFSCMIHVVK